MIYCSALLRNQGRRFFILTVSAQTLVGFCFKQGCAVFDTSPRVTTSLKRVFQWPLSLGTGWYLDSALSLPLISHQQMIMQQLKSWTERLLWGSVLRSHEQNVPGISSVWVCWQCLTALEICSILLEGKQTFRVLEPHLWHFRSSLPINKGFLMESIVTNHSHEGLECCLIFQLPALGLDCFRWAFVFLVYEKSIL